MISCSRRFIALVLFVQVCSLSVSARVLAQETDIAGHWVGQIEIPAAPLKIDADFRRNEAGQWVGDLSIPPQSLRDIPLPDLEVQDGRISFSLPGIPGNPHFEGQVAADGGSMAGQFTQGALSFPWRLDRGEQVRAEVIAALGGLEEWIEEARQKWNVPGIAVAVVAGGDVIFAQGFGQRNVEDDLPATPDTLFAIGSTTKAFTTFVLGTLVDEGRLDWDEPVRTYLPALRMYDDATTEQITARDMVTHRSGLPRHDLVWYGHSSITREQIFQGLRYLEPNATLRERWQYNNLMYATAGYLAGRITGQTWEALVRERIFEPLGMSRSDFSVLDAQKDPDFAYPYREDDDEQIVRIPFRFVGAAGPAGSINSSVNEMASWLELQLGGGEFNGQRLIAASTLSETHRPQMVMPSAGASPEAIPLGYAMGWMVDIYRGNRRVHHAGGIDGFTAMVSMIPAENLGVVALANIGTGLPSVVVQHTLDRLLGLEERDWSAQALAQIEQVKTLAKQSEHDTDSMRVQGTSPAHDLDEYVGRYTHPAYGSITITRGEGGLEAAFNDMHSPLKHRHYEVFTFADPEDVVLKGQTLMFVTGFGGRINAIRMRAEPMVEPILFERAAESSLTDPEYLASLTGEYAFAIAGQTVTIALRGKTLSASIPGQPLYELIPDRKNTFRLKGLDGFSVRFEIQDDGAVKEVVFIQPNGVFKATPID